MRAAHVAVLAALALVLAACAPEEVAEEPDPTPTPTPAPEPVCLEGDPFIADGEFPLEETDPSEDADHVSGLRWEAHEGCERVVIDVATPDGDPAERVGEVSAEVLRELGVVRVTLHDVERADDDATDETFDGPLATASYAARAEERWIDVDLHLGEAAEAYVDVLEEPGRVLVDLRPGGDPLPPQAATHDHVVVLTPRDGEATYPLTVAGYARTFEANVVVRLEQDGEEIEETHTTATAYVDAWGHYELTINDGPSGAVELHVGEYSARDGTWQGAVVELDMP